MSAPRPRRVGPYEILGLIGAGGMGEVYRARDPRLRRDVAIKLLPAASSRDPERLRRFEQEARAAGALHHPNILGVLDVGAEDLGPYIVAELLEGSPLRNLIGERPLPLARALDYAVQIARGLAAAHQKGILHRDVKPENLFVTKDGQLKILDFGLAKLKPDDALLGKTGPSDDTRSATSPGAILGTVGYMSPEQVSGLPADHRSDLFSFGAVLYEMLSGRRAFKGDTTVETMAAILKEDPPPISSLNAAVPPGLERLVHHCLEKRPQARFESARDLAFQLEGLSYPGMSGLVPPPPPRRRWRYLAGAGLAVALLGAGVLGGRILVRPLAFPEFRQLTFKLGTVRAARFSPDGHTVYFSAAWDGAPPVVFSRRLDAMESRELRWRDTELLSVAPGRMALLRERSGELGMLARADLDAGETDPRDIREGVHAADLAPRDESMAVVRLSGTGFRLEYPLGTVLHETAGIIDDPRVSPQGDRVAFIERPVAEDTGGSVLVAGRDGRKRTLSEGWKSVGGLAWSADGREIWFTAARTGVAQALHAVTLEGRLRLVARVAGHLQIQDISRDGRVLFTHTHGHIEVRGLTPGDAQERDLSHLDTTSLADLSADGKRLLFTDSGEGGGPQYSAYYRKLDEERVVRLGDGIAGALSPDGSLAVTIMPVEAPATPQVELLPTGAGSPAHLDPGTLTVYLAAWWFPDGQRLLVMGNEPGRPTRLFAQSLKGRPEPVGPAETTLSPTSRPLAPDGRFLAPCASVDTSLCLFRPEAGASDGERVPGLEPGDQPLSWSPDGRVVFVRSATPRGRAVHVFRVDRQTGARTFLREHRVADPAGAQGIHRILLTPDGRYYAYQFYRSLDVLYLAEGLR